MQQTPAFSHFWKRTTAASVFGWAEQRGLEASLKFSLQGQKTQGWEHSLAPLDPAAFCCSRAQGTPAVYSQCFIFQFPVLTSCWLTWRAKCCAAAQWACPSVCLQLSWGIPAFSSEESCGCQPGPSSISACPARYSFVLKLTEPDTLPRPCCTAQQCHCSSGAVTISVRATLFEGLITLLFEIAQG